uniref:Uncharacterized protein n=1 Tax=Anguilla anguilla TaxID=7936 RepID=A0A0E9UEW4_ANGAN
MWLRALESSNVPVNVVR